LLAEFRRAETLGRGFKSFERLSLKKGSSFVQQLRGGILTPLVIPNPLAGEES